MPMHLGVRLLPVAGGDGGGDRVMEIGINRLALVTMAVFTEATPADVALTGAHGIEEGEKQGVARGFRNGSMKQRISSFVGFRVGHRASLGRQSLQALDLAL